MCTNDWVSGREGRVRVAGSHASMNYPHGGLGTSQDEPGTSALPTDARNISNMITAKGGDLTTFLVGGV